MNKIWHRYALPLLCAATASAALLSAAPAAAQSAQGKTVKIELGFAAGGPVDAVARMIAEQLGKELGSTVILENRPGANAAIAAEYTAHAPQDGSVLWMTSAGAIAVNPSLYPKLGYDVNRDLQPVSLVANTVEVLVVSPSNPANNAAEFAANARKTPPNVGSSGIGSVPHLAMELLADSTKTTFTHVPYKGVAPAINDTIGGHVDGLFADVPVVLSFIRAGTLKPLGIAAPHRHPLLPDVKTFEELGIHNVDSNNWYGIYTGKGVPTAEVNRISQAVRRALANPDLKARMLAVGVEPAPTTPAELGALAKADTAKWSRIVIEKNIKDE